MPKINAKYIHAALFAVVVLFLSACGHYPAINVKVVDAETSEPIEGAVIISHWNINGGFFGVPSKKTYKISESVSDNNGHILISGASDINLEPPTVNIYRRGYVGWNNKYIFPTYDRRNGFQWKDNYVFRLERFKEEYSISDHVKFLSMQDHSGIHGTYREAWRWEALLDQ